MDQNFLYLYKQLTGKSACEATGPDDPDSVLNFMAGLMDDKHTVVLNALLDEIKKEFDGAEPGAIAVGPAEKTLEMMESELRGLLDDMLWRLDEFRAGWRSRLAPSSLLSYLKSGGWIEPGNGGLCLAGKGTKSESRKLYQDSLQDMAVEGIRILALFDGILARLQEKLAGEWRRETAQGNPGRLLPLFEETLRFRETEIFRAIRGDLPGKFSSLFVSRVNGWNDRVYPTEEELYRNMAWPWYDSEKNQSGFEGFMLFVADFIREMIILTSGLFRSRWRLFLRGLERMERTGP